MSTRIALQMTAPLREDFTIPYHDLGPPAETPAAALVAGVHGDELNGVFVLARLATFLGRVAAGEQPGCLRARVLIVPAVNVLGLNICTRTWPFDKTDINRMFPGYDRGETTQRIAAAVTALTRPACYRVDIHASNREFEELPQVRLYGPTDAERAAAQLFGLPAVIERPLSAVLTSTLVHAWRDTPGERYVLQAGHAGGLQPGHCERLFQALLAFLVRKGLLDGVPLAEEPHPPHHFGVRQGFPLISDHAGIFVASAEVGRWLQAGAVIGQVYDGFTGALREEIHAPVPGLLTGIRRQPLLYQGDLVGRIQTTFEVAEEVDTYLHGHGQ
jgi:uncharacterized protein